MPTADAPEGRDPDLYDATMALRERTWDVDWYGELAARSGGAALEIGAGTGRILLALLARGVDVDGLELDPRMAAALVARLPDGERGRVVCAGLEGFAPARPYGLVYAPYNVLSCFASDEALARGLRAARACLVDGGRFAFDVILAEGRPWSRPPYRWQGAAQTITVRGTRATFEESGRFDPVTRRHEIAQIVRYPDGTAVTSSITLYPRPREALDDALRGAGLRPTGEIGPVPSESVYAAVWEA